MKRIITAAVAIAALAVAGPAAASRNHWCRNGDPPVLASASTSCAFASNALSRYYQARGSHYLRARVYSPVTHKSYVLTYRRGGGRWSGDVTATGPNGIWLRFNWSYVG